MSDSEGELGTVKHFKRHIDGEAQERPHAVWAPLWEWQVLLIFKVKGVNTTPEAKKH